MILLLDRCPTGSTTLLLKCRSSGADANQEPDWTLPTGHGDSGLLDGEKLFQNQFEITVMQIDLPTAIELQVGF